MSETKKTYRNEKMDRAEQMNKTDKISMTEKLTRTDKKNETIDRMNLYRDQVIRKWSADLYDEEETQTEDVDFLLNLIGPGRKNVLEVCCGSGRILVPLAKAGHLATGFDIDECMMEKLEGKAEGLSNIKWYHNDAVKDDWGNGYDVTVLAGNILINIETDMDYKEAQELFLQKAYDSLNKGGYLYLDFNLFMHPEKFFQSDEERVIFEGTDHSGNHGILKIKKGFYDPGRQICYSDSNITLRTTAGEIISKDYTKVKHIPTLENVNACLSDTGFRIIKICGDYHGGEINEQTGRAIIWAEK